jgi:tRNA(fMet)-specific endonuclease VapC
MPMLKYMIDTNIAIYTLKNRPAKVRAAFKKHSGEMCLSVISLGELIFGAEKSARVEHNLTVIEGFAARLKVESFNAQAAVHFGQLRAELAKSGKLIGPYDMMIAGHARAMGLILVTNNRREFDRVPGLRIENWA